MSPGGALVLKYSLGVAMAEPESPERLPRSKSWLCLCQYELLSESLPALLPFLREAPARLRCVEADEALCCIIREALFCKVLRPRVSPGPFSGILRSINVW